MNLIGNRKTRVLVITSTYPRHNEDYAVPWMRETHRRLLAKGNEVTVLAPSYKGLKSHELDGAHIQRFRYAPAALEVLTHEEGATYKIRNSFIQLLAVPYLLFGCLAAMKLVRRKQFDVIHVHWPFPHGVIGQVAARFAKCPLIMMSHGAELALAKRKKWIRPILRQSLRAADVLIANSSHTASEVRRLSGKSCEVLPYGTTVRRADVGRPPINELPRVLFTGRLVERKGLVYLLRAVPQVLQTHDVKFVLTGDGSERPILDALVKELDIQEHVEFLGFVGRDELADQYRRCAMWVNPGIVDSWGDAEGLGIGSIEACTYGKPVVSTSVGGIPDTVLHDITGLLVPQKDATALAAAISELLSNPKKARAMGRAGFNYSQQKFCWERIIARQEILYLRTLVRCQRFKVPISGQHQMANDVDNVA